VALARNCIFVEDGKEPAIAEGAGTIGIELLRLGPLDAIVLPVGDGALITGVARWIKHHAPDTRIVGVCAVVGLMRPNREFDRGERRDNQADDGIRG
jgi:threonine dehydratase